VTLSDQLQDNSVETLDFKTVSEFKNIADFILNTTDTKAARPVMSFVDKKDIHTCLNGSKNESGRPPNITTMHYCFSSYKSKATHICDGMHVYG
jgi:hypothetical protein